MPETSSKQMLVGERDFTVYAAQRAHAIRIGNDFHARLQTTLLLSDALKEIINEPTETEPED